MSSALIVAGLGIAASGRYLLRNRQLLSKFTSAIPTGESFSIFSKYYVSGFDAKMSRREASLILNANKIKEAHKCNAPLRLNADMLAKLERLSAIHFLSYEEIEALQEDICFADKVFEINTEGVEPLYNIVDEFLNCPLRDDVTKSCSKEKTLSNAKIVVEDFFMTPKANIPLRRNELFDKIVNRQKSE